MLEKMMDNIIQKYGFENKNTIRFFRACENADESEESVIDICTLYNSLMND